MLSVDWLGVLAVTLAILAAMLIGFWIGTERTRQSYQEHWRDHLRIYHGITKPTE